jgi:hypothetical protein
MVKDICMVGTRDVTYWLWTRPSFPVGQITDTRMLRPGLHVPLLSEVWGLHSPQGLMRVLMRVLKRVLMHATESFPVPPLRRSVSKQQMHSSLRLRTTGLHDGCTRH